MKELIHSMYLCGKIFATKKKWFQMAKQFWHISCQSLMPIAVLGEHVDFWHLKFKQKAKVGIWVRKHSDTTRGTVFNIKEVSNINRIFS